MDISQAMNKLPDFSKYYADDYENILYGSGIKRFSMGHNHKLLERPFNKDAHFSRVIEIGGGLGYHIPFVRHSFDSYLLTDGSEAVAQKLKTISLPEKIETRHLNGGGAQMALPFEDDCFDRLIASNVLEHIPFPEKALAEWSRVLKDGGVLSISLPCDPGLLWRLGRQISMAGLPKTVNKKDWYVWVMQDHINPITRLIAFIRYMFNDVKEYFWPARIPFIDVNLFYIAHIKNHKKEITE